MTRVLALLILLCSSAALSVAAAEPDGAHLSRAMALMRKGDWGEAIRAAGPDRSIANDIIEWHRLRAGRGSAAQVRDFLSRRSDWPGLEWLRRRSEPAFAGQPAEEILEFFGDDLPQTAEGALTLSSALARAGRSGEAEAGIVLAWRTLPMGSTIQALYLAAHADLLAPHHVARLDRMLWDGELEDARRMLPLVSEGQRALARARMALREEAPGVDALIEAVPVALRDSAGLAHDRFEWRWRKGRHDDAAALLLERSKSAEALGEPERWAGLRERLARREMREGDAARAHALAARHFLGEGSSFAELEWLAGYIALHRLNDPAAALAHFTRFENAVESPISRGRAGYWLGRAHEALGNGPQAQAAYAMGARHQSSFYGLLAAERAGLPFDRDFVHPPAMEPWQNAPFASSSVLAAGRMLLSAGEDELGTRFLTHLVESQDAAAAAQLGEMAIGMERPHLALMIAKRAAQRSIVLHSAYYPLHPVAQEALPMAPEMTLAIARRESEFDPAVVSHAGARGLMQVMPATAQAMASQLGLLARHDTARLTREWDYNARLGANYLATLAGRFGGNVVMMAAGYNAGPGRPARWMEERGDPRRGDVDMVDWIEQIPFDETRNYVMRVTESLPVYRARLGLEPLPVPFSRELAGSTLDSFAP
ncbi:lytic transglycosylase domain-containing protein [Pontibaca methylaminivorans]|uniref:Soluble lytic murein transglycosylase n=1 Tax=Pontibaca methylaminivorans TaxID=515897 RepID=A0A1R3WRE4_9RHOB|nr:lytic transglycosylase domain-containing protein [Pontibaca methylaminivorans]SIT79834.1 soluble lytic murein transglycosylase [Pontibaca methylaminivorans]